MDVTNFEKESIEVNRGQTFVSYLHSGLLIQTEVSGERNDSFTSPHALLEVNTLPSVPNLRHTSQESREIHMQAYLDSQLRADYTSVGAEPLHKGSPVLLHKSDYN